MSYIEPQYRGQGLSSLLYQARIDFALSYEPWTKLIISHRDDNIASKNAMIRHGFQHVRSEEIKWPDGTIAFDHQYEMNSIVKRSE